MYSFNEMHPSTSVLLAKGFRYESCREIRRLVVKVIPFTYFEIEGKTHAINGIGESYVACGSVWPGPEFTELDPVSQLPLAA